MHNGNDGKSKQEVQKCILDLIAVTRRQQAQYCYEISSRSVVARAYLVESPKDAITVLIPQVQLPLS